jgi:hypothetical protein
VGFEVSEDEEPMKQKPIFRVVPGEGGTRVPPSVAGDVTRRVLGAAVAEDHPDVGRFRQLFIERQGPTAAAWLIFKHRKSFHAAGAFAFVLREGEKLPRWAEFGFEALKMRPKRWTVECVNSEGKQVWVVRWKAWRLFSPLGRQRARNERKRARRHLRLV